tara:strand:+ start:106 stop:690 length:585 start_codon:yes stop_codon:yes gene_type:complete
MLENNTENDKKFLDDYWNRYQKLLIESRNDKSIICLRDAIKNIKLANGRLLFFGNGASASLCSHAATDFTKQAKITSISFNDHNLITALSNDYGYEQWVSKAIEFYSNENDMIFFISVSGESKNLLNGIDFANLRNQKTASLTGSKKTNRLRTKAKFSLWVDSKAYNIVESIHTIWITLIIDMIVGHPEYSVKD